MPFRDSVRSIGSFRGLFAEWRYLSYTWVRTSHLPRAHKGGMWSDDTKVLTLKTRNIKPKSENGYLKTEKQTHKTQQLLTKNSKKQEDNDYNNKKQEDGN